MTARIGFVLATWIYAVALHVAHVVYLNPTWGYYGFAYESPGFAGYLLMVVLTTVGAVVMPTRFARPSVIVLLLLYIVVYVPTVVFTPAVAVDATWHYGPVLISFVVAFSVACIVPRLRLETYEPRNLLPGKWVIRVLAILWAAGAAILIVRYGSIMRIVGLDETYFQRDIGSAESGALLGYLQTHFGIVLSPAMLAIGLVSRRWLCTIAGIAGCVMLYAITAQRTIILIPLVMIAFQFAFRSRLSFIRTPSFVVTVAAFLSLAATAIAVAVSPASTLPVYLQFRTLGLPGLTFSQYYDLFSVNGFTYWSHVRGIGLLISPPALFAESPVWPALGRVVGEFVYARPDNNHIANLFVTDGVAAAGGVGVLVLGAFFAGWLWLLDRVSRNWDRDLVILIMLPVALTLTNAQLFTTLLSFGGLLWLVVFHFLGPRQAEKPAISVAAAS